MANVYVPFKSCILILKCSMVSLPGELRITTPSSVLHIYLSFHHKVCSHSYDITMILLNSIVNKRITFHSYNKFNTRLLNYKGNLLIFEL